MSKMKYIMQLDGSCDGYAEDSSDYMALLSLPEDRRPTFLEETAKPVQEYLATRTEVTNLAQEKATKAQAVAELIEELLGDKLSARIVEIRAARANKPKPKR
jgi:hypothetical protein